MPDAPKSSSLLDRVRIRLQITSVAQAMYVSSLVVLGIAIVMILAIRLLGLLPNVGREPLWLLAIPIAAGLSAILFHRRIDQQAAARQVDEHAKTKDLFLTLSTISNSAGAYQPLVTASAEERAAGIDANEVVPFRFSMKLVNVAAILALIGLKLWLLPQWDPFGTVEAATKVERQKTEVEAIHKETLARKDRLKKEAGRAAEESDQIDDMLTQLKKDFRKMQPKKSESNAKVLDAHRMDVNDKWKSANNQNSQLKQMLNQPISNQQLGGTRNQKMNEWLKDLQEGKTEQLREALKTAQQTMQAMAEAKDPADRAKLASKLQKELQDLNSFAKNKANSKELANALSKAMKALQAARPGEKGEAGEKMELTKDAMEALKDALELSEQEMEQVAQAAKDMKKLEDAMETLAKAQELNQNKQLDGSRCEGCESMEDYAELYAQMMGEGAGDGEGEKDRNDGGDGGVGKGGATPEDDSDPEGYKTEKEKPQIQAGKILLSIKTKEYAEELDFDPDKMREYQKSISSLKASVQSAIDAEEIPPGYVESIKGYFDKIEEVDPKRKAK
jgi:myosin heavy subunit